MVEDFTTYTECDPNNKIHAYSSTSITFAGLTGTSNGFMWKDYGIGYFGDFIIENDFEVVSVTTTTQAGRMAVFGLTNSNNDGKIVAGAPGDTAYGQFNSYAWDYGAVGCYLYFPTSGATNFRIYIYNSRIPTGYSDYYDTGESGCTYYMTYSRSGPTLYAEIYDDSDRLSLVDNLTCATHEYGNRYMYAISGGRTVPSAYNTWNGYIRNLSIESVDNVEIPNPSSNKAYDFTTFTDSTGIYGEVQNAYTINYYDVLPLRNTRVYKEMGTDYFDGEYMFFVNSCVTSILHYPTGNNQIGVWGIVDNCTCQICTSCWDNINNLGEYVMVGDIGTGMYYYLRSFKGGSVNSDNSMLLPCNWWCCVSIYKNTDTNTLISYLYIDDDRTELIDTLTVVGNIKKYDNLFAFSNVYNNTSSAAYLHGTIRYLKNVNVILPTEPSSSTEVSVPTDGADNAEWPVTELAVDIDEDEGSVTVYFYNAANNELIGTDTVPGGGTASVNWYDLDCEEEYGWYVVVDNGYSTATSDIWYFTCEACDVFTIASESYPTIHLDPPLWAEIQGKLVKIINRFSFWSENWAIHDEGIEEEPLTISGIQAISEAGDEDLFCDKFKDINAIMNLHEEIAVSGLGDCVDGYYYIKRFRYGTVKGAIRARRWTLELEFSREKTW